MFLQKDSKTHIQELASIFNQSFDTINSHLSPNFETRYPEAHYHHQQMDCKLSNELVVGVDVELVPLLTRLNSFYDNHVLTSQSCQCDLFGWANISFSFYNFQLLIMNLDKILKKIGVEYPLTGFYSHFMVRLFSKNFQMTCNYFSGSDCPDLRVLWRIDHNDLDTLCREFDEFVPPEFLHQTF